MQKTCSWIKREFIFLEKEFAFKIISQEEDDRFYARVVYKNKTTGVSVTYEYRDAYTLVMIYELINGEIVRNPGWISAKDHLYGFEINDALAIINPERIILAGYDYPDNPRYHDEKNGIKNYIVPERKGEKLINLSGPVPFYG